jgi:hypothetical protein
MPCSYLSKSFFLPGTVSRRGLCRCSQYRTLFFITEYLQDTPLSPLGNCWRLSEDTPREFLPNSNPLHKDYYGYNSVFPDRFFHRPLFLNHICFQRLCVSLFLVFWHFPERLPVLFYFRLHLTFLRLHTP